MNQQAERYIKTISQGVVKNTDGLLYYAPNLVKDQFAFDVAITHISQLIQEGVLTEANFRIILTANCRVALPKAEA